MFENHNHSPSRAGELKACVFGVCVCFLPGQQAQRRFRVFHFLAVYVFLFLVALVDS